ncbi:hypothetical protein QAD02_010119, partial [Eretmocerus hayati]
TTWTGDEIGLNDVLFFAGERYYPTNHEALWGPYRNISITVRYWGRHRRVYVNGVRYYRERISHSHSLVPTLDNLPYPVPPFPGEEWKHLYDGDEHWCLFDGEKIGFETCDDLCIGIGNPQITKGRCLYNVCFCRWVIPGSHYSSIHLSLESSKVALTKESNFCYSKSKALLEISKQVDNNHTPVTRRVQPSGEEVCEAATVTAKSQPSCSRDEGVCEILDQFVCEISDEVACGESDEGVCEVASAASEPRPSCSTGTIRQDKFMSEWFLLTKASIFTPLVTEVADDLVFISFPSDYRIKLESSNLTASPCVLTTLVVKKRTSKPLAAVGLGNGIVILSVTTHTENANVSNVYLFAINLHSCSFFADKFTFNDTVSSANHAIVLVPYQNTFDVFMRSPVQCETSDLCSRRYSDEIRLLNSIKSVISHEGKRWSIASTKRFSSKNGYRYVGVGSNSLTMKNLQSNLQTVSSIIINENQIISFSHTYDENSQLVICLAVSESNLTCQILNSVEDFQRESKIIFDGIINHHSVFHLSGQNFAIVVIISEYSGTKLTSYIQEVSAGKALTAVEFQDLSLCQTVQQMSVFKMMSNIYCVVVVCQNLINTKCIDIRINYRLP